MKKRRGRILMSWYLDSISFWLDWDLICGKKRVLNPKARMEVVKREHSKQRKPNSTGGSGWYWDLVCFQMVGTATAITFMSGFQHNWLSNITVYSLLQIEISHLQTFAFGIFQVIFRTETLQLLPNFPTISLQ